MRRMLLVGWGAMQSALRSVRPRQPFAGRFFLTTENVTSVSVRHRAGCQLHVYSVCVVRVAYVHRGVRHSIN